MGFVLILPTCIFKALCGPWVQWTQVSLYPENYDNILWNPNSVCCIVGFENLRKICKVIFLERLFPIVLSKGPGFCSAHLLDSSILHWKHHSELLTPFQLI